MRRRSWLKLGLGAAVVLAVGGGAVALVAPGLRDGRLAAESKPMLAAIGAAILDGVLPQAPAERATALSGLLTRTDAVIATLPPHAQAELSQLLSLLGTAPGRRMLAGLDAPWADASVQHVQAALQSMRTSSLLLRRQAYQGLHDLVGGAYFSDAGTWQALGYPGPVAV
jgi:hypothetical protein